MKFSIIVPVYKVEKYLHDCVESILRQTYQNFEIILVDDGSPDCCPLICDNYAKIDGRIIVCHKTNGGLSSARNAGIDLASGDYLIFVDSDDWIENNALMNFNDLLSKNPVDLLMTVKTSAYEDKTYQEVDGFENYLANGFDKKRAIDWILDKSQSVGAPNKIVRRDFIEKNNLRFLEGILHEDYDWTFKLCINANSFSGFSGKWYNYRMVRDGSITNQIKPENINSVIRTAGIYYDLYSLHHDQIHKRVYRKAMDALYISLNKIKFLDKKNRICVVSYLKKNKRVLKYASRFEQKLFLISCKVFGIRFSLFILSLKK